MNAEVDIEPIGAVVARNVQVLTSVVQLQADQAAEDIERAVVEARRDGWRLGYRAGYEQGTDDMRRTSEHLLTWTPPDLPTLEQACRRASERPELIRLAEAIADDPRVADEDLNEIITAVVARRAAIRGGKVRQA